MLKNSVTTDMFLTLLQTTVTHTHTINYIVYIKVWGLGWRSGQGTALPVGTSWDRFPVVSMRIFSVAPDGTMCPGVDSVSENEYQGFLLG